MNKVIFVDWSIFLHAAVFSGMRRQEMQFILPNCMRSIFACLKKIEINKEDLIIFAIDSKAGNWRKGVDAEYKANRPEIRKKTGLNWDLIYADFDALLENLKISTPFSIIEIDLLESDDIIAVGAKYFQGREIVILSSDSDFEQLFIYEGVKIFSPRTKKYKVVKGSAKSFEKKPFSVLNSKIKKEKTDNLTRPITSLEEYNKRDLIVNLIRLPDYVEKKVIERFENLDKCYDINLFRFPKMKEEIEAIYDNENKKIVTYSDSFKRKRKKEQLESLF